jgi:crossover junction endodeoxyribonuclease RuvC
MIILGIDPGITGGAAIISTEIYRKPIVEEAARMPIYMEGKKELIDSENLFKWWMKWPIDVVVIEWVHAMPAQGVTSSFSFGRSTGAVEAVAKLVAPKIVWVSPQRWKKHHGLLKKDKRASLDLAAEKFGDAWKWHKRVEDGIAEAALVALWCVDNLK